MTTATAVGIRIEDLCEDGLAQIVHDMRTPLATIALEATLFDSELAAGDRRRTSRAARRISDNVMFLDRLMQDLLDATAITTGRFTLFRRELELRALIDAVIDRIASQEQCRICVDAPSRARVLVDDLRMERVLANLIDNALKYTSRTTGVVVQMTADAGEASVSVTDVGPGIRAEELPTLFEPYRRGETSRGRPGSGLGLYVSKVIIEAHGGRLGVESARGVGTRFHFTLPAIT